MTKVVVLADTHIRRGSRRRLPDAAYEQLAGADMVLHAGDVLVLDLLHELEGFAPTFAVLGNNDAPELAAVLPEQRVLDVDGVRIGMVHDSGPRAGREGRLHRRFPGADVVVFGHSHVPVNARGIGDQWLMNPGSPTERRAQPHHTIGVLELGDGRVLDHRIVAVGPSEDGQRSIRANHRPGASTSAGVGSSRSSAQSRASASEPARSTTPLTKPAPRS